MIKAVIFDMDGVLIDAETWHYDALNKALALFGFEISRYEHMTTFNGLPTSKKLDMLSVTSGLPKGLHGIINKLKQQYTMDIVQAQCRPCFVHEYALSTLQARQYKLAVASNSIRTTVETMMQKARLTPYLDLMLSNEDVQHAKPSPEMYIKAMNLLQSTPQETLVLEDNENGIRAARASGAHVLEIRHVNDVNLDNILHAIQYAEQHLEPVL